MTAPDPRVPDRNAELPGDPVPLLRWLAQRRREAERAAAMAERETAGTPWEAGEVP